MPNSELFLSNSTIGYDWNEESFVYSFANETSVHANSSTLNSLAGPMSRAGRVVDVAIAVVRPATSASGFVSGTTTATLRVNSAAVCSTDPAINMAGSAGQAVYTATNAGGGISGVVNPASGAFAKGDRFSLDINARSVGSAAAGATGTGFYANVRVRYDAV